MKKQILLSAIFTLLMMSVLAQFPEAFNYQAVVRNTDGDVISNQAVAFRISILRNSASGTLVYSERHLITTNAFGLANLKVGDGAALQGNFSSANWGAANHYLKVEIDPSGGSSYSLMGTSQLLAVPYAFYAQSAQNDQVNDADADPENELQTLSISGTLLSLSNGGGTVTLPSSGEGGDNWGTQTVVSDGTLSGNGTSAQPLSVVGDLSDNQTLSLIGTQLSISDGNTVSLPESGTSLWTQSGDDIYYITGKVGIGMQPELGKLLSIKGGTGIFTGIYCEAEDVAIHGHSTDPSGVAKGGFFSSVSTRGFGLHAAATATSGPNYGGLLVSNSTEGTGVRAEARATSGVTYAGSFENRSPDGTAVYAEAIASSGTNYGGHFKSFSTNGRAIYGEASATSGTTYGGLFESNSSTGNGVYGLAKASSGKNFGGNFVTSSTSGRGVRGFASATSGETFGATFSAVSSPDGVGTWSIGGKWDFYAASTSAAKNYGSASSIRWKTNISPIDNPLEKIAAIRGVYYDWDAEHGGEHSIGCIAEEVGKVLPEIVVFEENGIDAEGMDYSRLTPLLIEAVKALANENKLLKEAVESLNTQMEAMENQ